MFTQNVLALKEKCQKWINACHLWEKIMADRAMFSNITKNPSQRWRVVCASVCIVILLHLIQGSKEWETSFQTPDNMSPVSMKFVYTVGANHQFCTQDQILLVAVISHPSEFHRRLLIRDSWAHANQYSSTTTKVVFFMGTPKGIDEVAKLVREDLLWHDIVVIKMEENYSSLSIKTLATLVFKETRCPNVKCLIKADSDNVLMLRNYEKLCKNTEASVKEVLGHCSVERQVFRTHSKWAVPKFVFPSKYYPKYCSSGTYMINGNRTTRALLEAVAKSNFLFSQNMRFLPEDVLFTGIFAEASHVNRRSIDGVSFSEVPTYDYQYDANRKQCLQRSYSIHMPKKKQPDLYFRVLKSEDGLPCPPKT